MAKDTYDSLKKEYEKIEKRIKTEEESCAEKGISFDDMIEQTKNDRIELFTLSKKMRQIQDPSLQSGKKWKGKFYTLDKFIELSNNKELTDEDGVGRYASGNIVSDVYIYPSDILMDIYRNDFTDVLWLNKQQ